MFYTSGSVCSKHQCNWLIQRFVSQTLHYFLIEYAVVVINLAHYFSVGPIHIVFFFRCFSVRGRQYI